MSKAKIETARALLITPGPFRVAELEDPHTGTPVDDLDSGRARTVVEWHRKILIDSGGLAPAGLRTARLDLLDAWLARAASSLGQDADAGTAEAGPAPSRSRLGPLRDSSLP